MRLQAVTANFACASPSSVGRERRRAAKRAAAQMRSNGVDVVFAQELPGDEWLQEWRADGYDYALGAGPKYRVRSAVIWRGQLSIATLPLPTADYHGSYLAAARLNTPDVDPIVLVSVHASPAPVTGKDLATWDSLRPRPERRTGAGRDAGRWFDADMCLDTLGQLASVHNRVIAAGDFNECRAYDDHHPGNWGQDYFANVEAAGLVSMTHERWGEERPTSFGAKVERYQLDHILATPAAAQLIPDTARIDPWDEASVIAGDLSDHAPIWFEINLR